MGGNRMKKLLFTLILSCLAISGQAQSTGSFFRIKTGGLRVYEGGATNDISPTNQIANLPYKFLMPSATFTNDVNVGRYLNLTGGTGGILVMDGVVIEWYDYAGLQTISLVSRNRYDSMGVLSDRWNNRTWHNYLGTEVGCWGRADTGPFLFNTWSNDTFVVTNRFTTKDATFLGSATNSQGATLRSTYEGTVQKGVTKEWHGICVVAGGVGQTLVNPTNSNGTPIFSNIYSVQATPHDSTTTAISGMATKVLSYGVNGTNITLLTVQGTTVVVASSSLEFAADGVTNRVTVAGD